MITSRHRRASFTRNERATSSSVASTDFAPWFALIRIGNTASSTTTTTFVVSWKPSTAVRIGTIAGSGDA